MIVDAQGNAIVTEADLDMAKWPEPDLVMALKTAVQRVGDPELVAVLFTGFEAHLELKRRIIERMKAKESLNVVPLHQDGRSN